ncbi:MAG: glutamine--fructose-6-phosphate transaminase (isomerizing), partial [Bdellovibrio sp.]|nr:glutamine--fructose-6-phosphate transaminase (isomerizing) [Bdellovibrio sp.]
MCGIVGYLGPQNPKDIIVNGLKKLEYRGYDSAGVAILDQGKTKRVRAQGKLKALEDKLVNEKFDGHIGIGHTRWATHGKPSEKNAHPHQVRGINLVHNGIIENYLDIREELLAQGAEITSDTDSELVAHLIANEVEVTQDLFKAVESVLDKIRGAFSILVMWEQEPDRLVAFKDGPPLVVGLGEKEVFVASDVQALIQYTKKFVYLEDREVASIKGVDVHFFSANGFPIQKKVVELNWNPEMVEKQGYAHYMLKEIYEQPRAVAAAIEPHVNPESFSVALKNVGFGGQPVQRLEELDSKADWAKTQEVFKGIERVFIIACGTSNYAGMVGKYLIEQLAKVPVEVDIASEFRYRNPVIPPKSLVITISQSGETADTLAALRLAKEAGATTLSVVNVKGSTIDRDSDYVLYTHAGPEIAVASTKAYTAQLSCLYLLAFKFALIRKTLTEEKCAYYIKELKDVIPAIEETLAFDKTVDDICKHLVDK